MALPLLYPTHSPTPFHEFSWSSAWGLLQAKSPELDTKELCGDSLVGHSSTVTRLLTSDF